MTSPRTRAETSTLGTCEAQRAIVRMTTARPVSGTATVDIHKISMLSAVQQGLGPRAPTAGGGGTP